MAMVILLLMHIIVSINLQPDGMHQEQKRLSCMTGKEGCMSTLTGMAESRDTAIICMENRQNMLHHSPV